MTTQPEITTDGDRGEVTGTVVATGGHPFWIDDEGRWVDAAELAPGDQVLTADGQRIQVTATCSYTAVWRVHNLTVSGIHTYYVLAGEVPILAHNQGGELDPINFGNGFTGRLDQYVSRGG